MRAHTLPVTAGCRRRCIIRFLKRGSLTKSRLRISNIIWLVQSYHLPYGTKTPVVSKGLGRHAVVWFPGCCVTEPSLGRQETCTSSLSGSLFDQLSTKSFTTFSSPHITPLEWSRAVS